jgi:hypothetical protein
MYRTHYPPSIFVSALFPAQKIVGFTLFTVIDKAGIAWVVQSWYNKHIVPKINTTGR